MEIRYVKLYDTYSSLLTERQREIMELYYNEDESLAEIAENTGITRQGVRDWIKKTEAQLDSLEEALGLTQKSELLRKSIGELSEAINNNDTERARQTLAEMETLLR
jgi:predicted DNA-binding protein YlxM (UPF0122 family)